MVKLDRIENSILVKAGLELMRRNEMPLTKRPSRGRAMLYDMPNGETVRVRTCNDHVLLAYADEPSPDTRLNIEGTNWLLIVMPEFARTPGEIIGYLVPTEEAVKEVHTSHRNWLDSNPKTKGNNRTRALWFDEYGPDVNGGEKYAGGYSVKWKKYRLEGSVSSTDIVDDLDTHANEVGNIKAEVEAAQHRIASIAGVSPQAVKISIDFWD